MHRLITVLLVVGGLQGVAFALGPPASAEKCPKQVTKNNVTVTVMVECGAGGAGAGGGGAGSDGGGDRICTFGGEEIPCNEGGKTWADPTGTGGYGGYCEPIADQPGPGHPAWGGHSPDEGIILQCGSPINGYFTMFAPYGDAVPALVDPAVLAQRALDQLTLATAEIRMAPEQPDATYVGLETWLWIPEPQWRTLDASAKAGPTRVTVTAKPTAVNWDLTEGATSCGSTGRPWGKGMTEAATTDCSYTFQTLSDGQPDGQFPVSAQIVYEVDWTCRGACLTQDGTLGQIPGPDGAAAIEVNERQTVVRR